MKNKAILFLASLLFILGVGRPLGAQVLVPQYSTLTENNPFAGYPAPIAVAILTFNGNALADIQLFNILKQDTSALRRFTIFPYNVLLAQMNVLHIRTLKASDMQTLKKLREELGIRLVITGNALANGIQLEIFSTESGRLVYKHNYLNSSKSTAVSDAAKLFSKNLQTRYIDIGQIKWVLVAGGSFLMGSADGYSDERPVHTVTMHPFYMSATEITFKQYDAFCAATGRAEPADSGWGRGNMPVFDINWNDAKEYCSWLSDQLGASIHLPTEDEFEYAARGGNMGHGYTYSGSNHIDDVGWFVGNSKGRPHKVGGRMPNELGIYDLSGNVWEWCQDWYHRTYDGAPSSDSSWNTQSVSTPYRVVRGGSWNSSSYNCRVSVRNDGTSTGWVNMAGFRLVKDIK